MTLIEAIKSGLPFRRIFWVKATCQPPTLWCVKTYDECGQLKLIKEDTRDFALTWEDILADDWEIQEPSVTITRTQFWDTCSQALKDWEKQRRSELYRPALANEIMPRVARILGLES